MATSITNKELKRFLELAAEPYDRYADAEGARKEEFHKIGRKALTVLASKLNLRPEQYDIRSNRAGPAIRGEVTLHADHLYVQFGDGYRPGVYLIRGCDSRQDYTGHVNRWFNYADLADLDKVAADWLAVMNSAEKFACERRQQRSAGSSVTSGPGSSS